jgi:peptidoglycan/LPS O-acetylase OafA/YrhL
VGYVIHNVWLKINQPSIAHTLDGVPRPESWNGSLWTLFYEFLCYLLLAALAVLGMLRRRWTVLLLAIAAWAIQFLVTAIPSLNDQFNVFTDWQAGRMLILIPIFLTGSLLYLYQDLVPDSGALALACVGVAAMSFVLPIGTGSPGYSLTSTDLFAFTLAYPLIWLGIHLPFRRVGSTNDYSYGVYVYAFPVSQLLALWGVYKWGYVPYAALIVAMTIPFAVASWWLIEKPALGLKRLGSKSSVSVAAADGA